VNRSRCAMRGLHCESCDYNAEPQAERNRFYEKGTIFGFRCPCRDDCGSDGRARRRGSMVRAREAAKQDQFLVRHPDRSQIPRPIAARQLHGVPPIRLHPIPGFDRHQGRRHHLALHPKRGQLPIENVSCRTRLIAGLQLLGRPQLLYQFANASLARVARNAARLLPDPLALW
jgi:hypothetical protein